MNGLKAFCRISGKVDMWLFLMIESFLIKPCDKNLWSSKMKMINLLFFNYTWYLSERDRIEKKKMDEYKREQEYLEKQKNLINRFRAWSRADGLNLEKNL